MNKNKSRAEKMLLFKYKIMIYKNHEHAKLTSLKTKCTNIQLNLMDTYIKL